MPEAVGQETLIRSPPYAFSCRISSWPSLHGMMGSLSVSQESPCILRSPAPFLVKPFPFFPMDFCAIINHKYNYFYQKSYAETTQRRRGYVRNQRTISSCHGADRNSAGEVPVSSAGHAGGCDEVPSHQRHGRSHFSRCHPCG